MVVSADLIVKTKEDNVYFVLKLSTNGKEKIIKETFKKSKEKALLPIDTLFSSLKKKVDLKIRTNNSWYYKQILELLREEKTEHNIASLILDKDLDFNIEDGFNEEYLNISNIPSYFNKAIDELDNKQYSEHLLHFKYLMKTFLFFSQNPEKITDNKLFNSLKEKGVIPSDWLIEDFLVFIEEAVTRD